MYLELLNKLLNGKITPIVAIVLINSFLLYQVDEKFEDLNAQLVTANTQMEKVKESIQEIKYKQIEFQSQVAFLLKENRYGKVNN